MSTDKWYSPCKYLHKYIFEKDQHNISYMHSSTGTICCTNRKQRGDHQLQCLTLKHTYIEFITSNRICIFGHIAMYKYQLRLMM